MAQLLIMALLIGVVIAGATASFPGRYHLLGTKKIYVQIVGRTVGNKTQTEFPVSGGPVQQFPNYTPGYQATYSAKFTKALDYFSAQLGTITGFVGATTNTSTFQTGTIAFKDGSGSIYFSGTADGSLSSKFVFSVTSGIGRYLGTFGDIQVSLANVTDSGTSITVLYTVTLYATPRLRN